MFISCSFVETESESAMSPTLKDIFIFLTGCDCVPPLGFPAADREILLDKEAVVPRVSTCTITLYVPMNMPTLFEERMNFFILGSQDFGQL